MIFELQKRSGPDLSGFAQDSLGLPEERERPKKKGRPRWTPSQKLGSGSAFRCPKLKLVRAKSHVESPSVVIEARNSCRTGAKTSNSDTEVVAQAVRNLCKCRKTCA